MDGRRTGGRKAPGNRIRLTDRLVRPARSYVRKRYPYSSWGHAGGTAPKRPSTASRVRSSTRAVRRRKSIRSKREAGALALLHSNAGRQEDESPVARRNRVRDGRYGLSKLVNTRPHSLSSTFRRPGSTSLARTTPPQGRG
jgi:hypothetical protein